MTSLELDVTGSGVGQSGAGFGGYNPSLEPEPPPDAEASSADAPAAAPARITRSGAAGELHANVLTSHRAAQTPVTTSATIADGDVGQSGTGFGGYNPSPATEPPPNAAASVADTPDEPATAPARLPRSCAERGQHESMRLRCTTQVTRYTTHPTQGSPPI